ncbi:MAG: hypothetical protein K6A43_13335 [Treponema sp.]|nr:hypothetical protein [Treponema sp.]
MADITRTAAVTLTNQMLRKYKKAINLCQEDKSVLTAEALKIVNDYESNGIEGIITKVLADEGYFGNYDNKELYTFFSNCRDLLKECSLNPGKDVFQVTGVTDKGKLSILSDVYKSTGSQNIKAGEKVCYNVMQGEKELDGPLSRLRYAVEWQLEKIETPGMQLGDDNVESTWFRDSIDNGSILFNKFDRSFTISEPGKYKVTANIYEKDFWGRPPELVDIVSYEQVVEENTEKYAIDFSKYNKSWIIVKKQDNSISKIIYNAGNGITFIDEYGDVLEEIPFDSSFTKTKFLNKHIGINNSNEILIKAGYSYENGLFFPKTDAKLAFDIYGNEESLDLYHTKIEKHKKKTKRDHPQYILKDTFTELNEKFNDNSHLEDELERFTNIVRNTIGATYSHDRKPTSSKMDCSGVFVYAMQKMGYKVDNYLTAARMASGSIPGIVLYESVDNSRQGNKGILNFYKWGTKTVQHVNYGVGKNEDENDFQIIDASEGDTWQSIRNNNSKQLNKAQKNKVNQTWAPFSTKTSPDIQAYLDFSKFDKEVEIK